MESGMNNILAIDVGRGHVKSVHRVDDAALILNKFPSLTLEVPRSQLAAGLGLVQIEVEGRQYCIGPDIELAVPVGTERERDDNYSTTPEYLALIRGALHSSKLRTIDVLVVGLPMTSLNNSAFLQTRLTGIHKVPAFSPADAAEGVTTNIHVKKVVVLAQAVGALAAACDEFPILKTRRILTLDYGFHTMDFLASLGMRPFTERLGAIRGGVATYIDCLQSSVASQIRKEKPQLTEFTAPPELYEEAIQRSPQVVRLGPGEFDLSNHKREADALLIQSLQKLLEQIQTANDLTTIVIAGGGANILGQIVHTQFPVISTVVKLTDPQFAIARGFYLYAKAIADRINNESYQASS